MGFGTHRHTSRIIFSERARNYLSSAFQHATNRAQLHRKAVIQGRNRPSVNYRNARGQLNQLVQRVESDEQLEQQYDKVVESYIEKELIEQIPNQSIEGHYMPYHAVFKNSAATPLRIVFNASSKPSDGKSLNDCLMTGRVHL